MPTSEEDSTPGDRSMTPELLVVRLHVVRAEYVARGAFNAEWQKFLDKI